MSEPLSFVKYQATGNDFILIDDRLAHFPLEDAAFIARLCHRRFGIGADGLILIRLTQTANCYYEMLYYNADGRLGSLCGNGSRAAAHFARTLGLLDQSGSFLASDGVHSVTITPEGLFAIEMRAAGAIQHLPDGAWFVDSGSPHYIFKTDAPLDKVNLEAFSVPIRYAEQYAARGGTNVNVIRITGENRMEIRTWERGVEAETLSCGTGATAAALIYHEMNPQSELTVSIQTMGGELQVRFSKSGLASGGNPDSVWLIGPAEAVFEGKLRMQYRSGTDSHRSRN